MYHAFCPAPLTRPQSFVVSTYKLVCSTFRNAKSCVKLLVWSGSSASTGEQYRTSTTTTQRSSRAARKASDRSILRAPQRQSLAFFNFQVLFFLVSSFQSCVSLTGFLVSICLGTAPAIRCLHPVYLLRLAEVCVCVCVL